MDSIKREVEESQPLLGDLEAPEALLPVYAENPQFAAKVPDFARQFSGLRRSQGDGNCAYRSFAVSLAERFLDAGVKLPDAAGAAGAAGAVPSPMQAFYERTLKYLRDSLGTLVDAFGYSSFTTEDFQAALLEYFEALGRPGADKETHVFGPFRDKMQGFYLITYLRCLVSLQLLSNEDEYLPFVLGTTECATVKMFCDTQVEAVSVDADQLQLTAMAKGWGCRIRIAYLDASPGDKVHIIEFPQDAGAAELPLGAELLYRPGHYDIAYAR